MYLVTIALALLVWYLFTWYKWWRDVFRNVEDIPGLRWLPIVGTTHYFLGVTKEKLFERLVSFVKEFDGIFRAYNGTDAEVHITKADYVEVIMKSSTHLSKGKVYNLLLPWLGEGLLISKGAKWFQHRKLITPAFHFKILENFMEVFVDKSRSLVESLSLQADGKYHNIYPNITHCALDIICETAMGVSINAMSNTQSDYVKSIYDISDIISWRSLRPYYKWDPLFNLTKKGRKYWECIGTLHGFSKKVIADRKKLYNKQRISPKAVEDEEVLGKKKRLSFLDILLEASEDQQLLNETDLREEVDTFIFEGHDTTTAAICWSLFLLGNYPKIQEKVHEEIKSVLGDKPTPTTLGELSELKYLECIIKEALRLYPSVPIIARTLTEEIEMGGYKIPADVVIVVHIFHLHKDPEQFPDPEKFDPDRFLPENTRSRHPYAYVPFSAGPRNCIGQKFAMYEEKTILASILKEYRLTSEEKQEDVRSYADLILRPQKGVNLKLEKRLK